MANKFGYNLQPLDVPLKLRRGNNQIVNIDALALASPDSKLRHLNLENKYRWFE